MTTTEAQTKADEDPVLAAYQWNNNGRLVQHADELGYVGDKVLDLTYGEGVFWKYHRPTELVTNDVNPAKGEHHYDATASPPAFWCLQFDSVWWDAPYRLSGKKDGGFNDSDGEFDGRYGLDFLCHPDGTPFEWHEVQDYINAGVTFAYQCVKLGGYVMVKCQNQVARNAKRMQTYDTVEYVRKKHPGLRFADEFVMTRKTARKQPPGRPQRHTRSNYSTLLVFQAA